MSSSSTSYSSSSTSSSTEPSSVSTSSYYAEVKANNCFRRRFCNHQMFFISTLAAVSALSIGSFYYVLKNASEKFVIVSLTFVSKRHKNI